MMISPQEKQEQSSYTKLDPVRVIGSGSFGKLFNSLFNDRKICTFSFCFKLYSVVFWLFYFLIYAIHKEFFDN